MEELPLQHFSHEQPLALCEEGNDDGGGGGDGVRKCFGCSQSVVLRCGSPTYYTSPQCEFFLHKSCATELPEEMELELLLQHFSHEHPLALCEEGNDDGGGGGDRVRKCFGCSQSVVRGGSPTYYTCPQCEFFLHKSCTTELPEKIVSFLHSRHPLTRIVANETWNCNGCDVAHDSGFAYNCYLCEFNLDIKCVSLSSTSVIHEYSQSGCYNHSFMLLRSVSFYCDVCGSFNYNDSYLCTTCQFQSCLDCFPPFPLTVKQIGHRHRLSFTSYIDDPLVANSINYLCKLCLKEVDKKFCFYYCADCNYVTHLRCATAKDLLKDDDDENTELLLLQPQHTLHSFDDHLEHFSHQHCLTLMNDDGEAAAISEEESNEDDDHNKIICDGCVQQISSSSSTPFYGCAKCNFFLHTSCAQLPTKILHPLHEHALFLSAEASKRVASVFECYACGTLCNGFVYTCERSYCDFFIDVKCSFFSADPFKHKGHCSGHNVEADDQYYSLKVHKPHQYFKKNCSACDFHLPDLYGCDGCSFRLDMRCAALPYTIKHKCPNPHNTRHLLDLTFESIDDVTDEYYCDMCEEKRGKDNWFYYCSDCDYAAHPECALGKHRIKFGKSYKFSAYYHPHPHPLTLTVIERTKGKPPSCSSCTRPCKELTLMCAECNFYVHYEEPCSFPYHKDGRYWCCCCKMMIRY